MATEFAGTYAAMVVQPLIAGVIHLGWLWFIKNKKKMLKALGGKTR